tara:strand:+ start:3301 stop:3435 length:135 start_codon:yes stop_codon:yes gene_type:complete
LTNKELSLRIKEIGQDIAKLSKSYDQFIKDYIMGELNENSRENK